MKPEELIALLENRKQWLSQQRNAALDAGDIINVDLLDQQIIGCSQSLAALHAGLGV